MNRSNLALSILLFYIAPVSASALQSSSLQKENKGVGRRLLLSYKETPSGSNVTFECSPSGPCVLCQYSEKNDEKYRCSETGYRIPLKCVEVEDGSKDDDKEKKSKNSRSTLEISHRHEKEHAMMHAAGEITTSIEDRRLQDDSTTLEDRSHAYITYRSCIPSINEEKLSVLGFEGMVFGLLLVSGSVVYFRRKQTVAMSGVAGRIQTNSRF
ncbi:hypothetical protein CFOL_v3_20519 [Cephalotus follicularis]|uniref:Structural polyprotein n=1 Tax=Cephalotus follicularis TaxID=3775 RepID=A0A1Q3C9X8_CEPFO|nr:hypothetical protein CFOL_v3_20519 [Cephalotus follicularis]